MDKCVPLLTHWGAVCLFLPWTLSQAGRLTQPQAQPVWMGQEWCVSLISVSFHPRCQTSVTMPEV